MEAIMTMTGNLGADVEFYEAKADGRMAYATFRLACTPRSPGEDGEWRDEPTTWLKVACFKQLAENVARSFHKGEPVMVVGRLHTKTWIDQETGEVRERLQLTAITAGHDLKRGTAGFKKKVRLPGPDERAAIGDMVDDGDVNTLEQRDEESLREVAAA